MSSTPPSSLPQQGDLLAGKYRVERVLGQGGMGIVFAAHHELLAQRVAVKLLLAEGPQRADASVRFLQEARSAARVQHENIARVTDVGTLENGTPYMVMEYLEGSDLSVLLQGTGPLEPSVAVDYVLQALEAIGQAHALGIVHRDLKPANLFLAKRIDGSSIVKVLDFGISKSTDPLHAGAQTSTQSMLGSPYYMSPEQLRSSKNVDKRADIWSVGVILYELLTASLPFEADTLGGLFAAILETDSPSILARRRDVPPGLDEVVRRCMARRAEDRFANAAELAWALSPFASPAGVASAERIQARGLGTTGTGSGERLAVGGVTAPGATTGRGRTAASWQTSQTTAAPAKSKAWVAIVFGVATVAVIGAVVLWKIEGPAATQTPSAAASPNADALPPPAPVAVTPAPVVSAAPAESAAGSASTTAAAPAVAPQPPTTAATQTPAAHRPAGRPAARPSATPRATAPGYDPTKDTRN